MRRILGKFNDAFAFGKSRKKMPRPYFLRFLSMTHEVFESKRAVVWYSRRYFVRNINDCKISVAGIFVIQSNFYLFIDNAAMCRKLKKSWEYAKQRFLLPNEPTPTQALLSLD